MDEQRAQRMKLTAKQRRHATMAVIVLHRAFNNFAIYIEHKEKRGDYAYPDQLCQKITDWVETARQEYRIVMKQQAEEHPVFTVIRKLYDFMGAIPNYIKAAESKGLISTSLPTNAAVEARDRYKPLSYYDPDRYDDLFIWEMLGGLTRAAIKYSFYSEIKSGSNPLPDRNSSLMIDLWPTDERYNK